MVVMQVGVRYAHWGEDLAVFVASVGWAGWERWSSGFVSEGG